MTQPVSENVLSGIARRVPDNPRIDELREEFWLHGLNGGWLWPWLTRVLMLSVFARLKSRYAAATYSPSRAWDTTGAWDLAQDFIARRCVQNDALGMALKAADNATGAKRYLEKAFVNFVISERRRDTASNVRRRLAEVLARHPRLRPLAGIGKRAAYGLDEWSGDPPALMDTSGLLTAERFIPEGIVLTEYSTGERNSPGLTSVDLSRVAVALVEGTGALWTGAQIMTVLQHRFLISQDDPDEPAGGSDGLQNASVPPPLDALVANDLANRAVSSLSPVQCSVLRTMIANPGLGTRALSAKLVISKSQVNNEQHRIAEVFAALSLTGSDEREQILQLVAELLGDGIVSEPGTQP